MSLLTNTGPSVSCISSFARAGIRARGILTNGIDIAVIGIRITFIQV